jgi:hypothetical protein
VLALKTPRSLPEKYSEDDCEIVMILLRNKRAVLGEKLEPESIIIGNFLYLLSLRKCQVP